MTQLKKILMKNRLWLLFLIIFLFSVSLTAAQNKVVVIPLFDEKSGPPAPVPETGQTTSYATGDDGEWRKGIASPNPRFTDNGDGTVADNLTGLIWLKNANCPNGKKMWSDALTFSNSLYDGWTGDGSGGDCGLSDGSSASDWRLPNVRELFSLIDFSRWNPKLPTGHPFTGVRSDLYWTSTTDPSHTDPPGSAMHVYMNHGDVVSNPKDFNLYVWPVRGGND